ncbi:inter-alpha-trypsin inhibitor heavy chain H3-like [Saccoglossus kowalevskii]|uniref:Inter-alpha-trypsin inhibitor heavy chain H3-like n=1 Tax=Saccoglossus kowalevskii TaxID=10224 RepID=A0ABM0M687_SACKO|nr:PREDICTED: inter-alpha-trypsin inhibitor heavy chain H3-like [Saccoglossus kowalevskii]
MLPWKPMKMVMGNITLRVSKSRTFSVSQGEGITLVIHLVRKHPPTIGDYFGFYIEDGRGFSEMVHGLIGQFHSGKISIENMRTDIFDPIYQQADLRVGDRNVTVYENYRKDPKNNLRIRCWFAHNNARGVIDGKHKDYFVQSIFSRDFSAP